jgi:hypothetical protein
MLTKIQSASLAKGAVVVSPSLRPRFHAHRLYPRFAGLTRVASRAPSVNVAVLALGGRLLQDTSTCASEELTFEEAQSINLVVCGLERSGTTFLTHAARARVGDSMRVWKTHDPYSPRDFLPRGVPVIVTLRSPLDTAISKATYHGDPSTPKALCRRLDLVTTWLRLFAREAGGPNLTLAEFDDFVADPAHVLDRAAVPLPITNVTTADVTAQVDSSDVQLGLDSRQTHTPNQHRFERRSSFEAFVDDAAVRRRLALAVEAMDSVRRRHGA